MARLQHLHQDKNSTITIFSAVCPVVWCEVLVNKEILVWDKLVLSSASSALIPTHNKRWSQVKNWICKPIPKLQRHLLTHSDTATYFTRLYWQKGRGISVEKAREQNTRTIWYRYKNNLVQVSLRGVKRYTQTARYLLVVKMMPKCLPNIVKYQPEKIPALNQ